METAARSVKNKLALKYIRDCPLNCDFNYFEKTKALEYKVGPYGLLFS